MSQGARSSFLDDPEPPLPDARPLLAFTAGQLARCTCGRAFAEVLPGVTLTVRPATSLPDPAAAAARTTLAAAHLRHRCRRCSQELDVQVLSAALTEAEA